MENTFTTVFSMAEEDPSFFASSAAPGATNAENKSARIAVVNRRDTNVAQGMSGSLGKRSG